MRFSLFVLLAAAGAGCGLVSVQGQGTIYYDAHPGNAIVGGAFVPDSSKSLCPDLVSVQNQCTASLSQAKTVCANDPNCGGLTCNTARGDCQLRYYPLTPLDPTWTGFNSYKKFTYNVHNDWALFGSYAVPDASKSTCPDLTSVTPQCTVDNGANGLTICANDPNCVGLTCNVARGDCQLRYYPVTQYQPQQGFITKTKVPLIIPTNIYYDAHPGNAITGGAFVPPSSKSLCPDLVSVQNQCTASLSQAKIVCANDPNCGGLTCNTARGDCQLRYYPLTPLDSTWTGFNSYKKFAYNVYNDWALFGSYAVPDASKSKCPDLTSVTPQCTVDNGANGLTICANDPNCVGLTCNVSRGDCQLRYYPVTQYQPQQGFITKTKLPLP